MYDRDEAVPVDTDHFEKELKRKQVMGKMLWSELLMKCSCSVSTMYSAIPLGFGLTSNQSQTSDSNGLTQPNFKGKDLGDDSLPRRINTTLTKISKHLYHRLCHKLGSSGKVFYDPRRKRWQLPRRASTILEL